MRSFSDPAWGLQNFRVLIDRPVYLRALGNTVVVSATVTAVCLLLGYPLAYTMANAGPRFRRLLVFAVLIPFWTSLLVRTFAWMVLLQQKGLINQILLRLDLIDHPLTLIYNRIGVVVGMVHILLPFMILPLYSVLTRIDRATAMPRPAWAPRRSAIPARLSAAQPAGVLTGTVLVFVVGLGYYITPALLGGPGDTMIAQLIESQVAEFGRWGLAGALALILLLGTSVTFGLVQRTLATSR